MCYSLWKLADLTVGALLIFGAKRLSKRPHLTPFTTTVFCFNLDGFCPFILYVMCPRAEAFFLLPLNLNRRGVSTVAVDK